MSKGLITVAGVVWLTAALFLLVFVAKQIGPPNGGWAGLTVFLVMCGIAALVGRKVS